MDNEYMVNVIVSQHHIARTRECSVIQYSDTDPDDVIAVITEESVDRIARECDEMTARGLRDGWKSIYTGT